MVVDQEGMGSAQSGTHFHNHHNGSICMTFRPCTNCDDEIKNDTQFSIWVCSPCIQMTTTWFTTIGFPFLYPGLHQNCGWILDRERIYASLWLKFMKWKIWLAISRSTTIGFLFLYSGLHKDCGWILDCECAWLMIFMFDQAERSGLSAHPV